MDIFNINTSMKSKEKNYLVEKKICALDLCLKFNINSTKSINNFFFFLCGAQDIILCSYVVVIKIAPSQPNP